MSGEAPEEPEQCWTCGGDWEICRHGDPAPSTTGQENER